MWNDTDLFRTAYLGALMVPLLIGILAAGKSLLPAASLLIGWILLGVGQNLLNDLFDQDRDIPLDQSALTVLFLVATGLGLMLLRPVLPYALGFIAAYSIYNWRYTDHVLGTVLNPVGFAILPFLSLSGPLIYLPLIVGYGLFGTLLDMRCDADLDDTAMFRATIRLTGLATSAYTLFLIHTRPDTVYLLPFAIGFAVAALYPPRYDTAADKTALVYTPLLAAFYLIGVAISHGLLPGAA